MASYSFILFINICGTGKKKSVLPQPLTYYPFVTVQLPVYNESVVVARLIDAVAKFDYPVERWEIQILDDSTDDTTAIIRNTIEQYKDEGLQIHHIRRSNRVGYKAGALQNGLRTAKANSLLFLMPILFRLLIFYKILCLRSQMKMWAWCKRGGLI